MKEFQLATLKFRFYLLIATAYGIFLSISIDYLTAFSTAFFICFVLADNGLLRWRLLVGCFAVGLAVMSWFIWPVMRADYQLSGFLVALVATFTALNLLAAYHKADSLRPPYSLFFDEVWTNFVILLGALIFVGFVEFFVYLLSTLLAFIGLTSLKHFLSYRFVDHFILGFSGVIGIFLVKMFERSLYFTRYVFIFFGRLFFLGLTLIAVLLLLGWAVQGFPLHNFKLDSIDFTYLLSWFCILGLVFLNMAYPYEVRDKKFSLLRRYTIIVYIILGFILALLANVTYVIFQYAQQAHYAVKYPMLNGSNLIDYVINALIGLYYLGYVVAFLMKPHDFLTTSFPRVNIALAWLLIVVMLLLNNPLTFHFLHLPAQPNYLQRLN